jgi:hypothetical protein
VPLCRLLRIALSLRPRFGGDSGDSPMPQTGIERASLATDVKKGGSGNRRKTPLLEEVFASVPDEASAFAL